MKKKTYQVTFSGRLASDLNKKDVLSNLAVLFRKDPERIRKAFNASGAVVAECSSREEAARYTAAIRRAGAICEIREREELPTVSEISGSAPSAEDPAAPRTIDPIGGRTDPVLSPMSCSRIGASPDGLTTNRIGRTIIPYGQLTMVSIFKTSEDRNEIMAMFFDHSARRPLIIEASAITFADFPETADINLISSLRNFLTFLVRKNPAIVIDRETAAFLTGGAPPLLSRDPVSLASDLNRAFIQLPTRTQ